MRWALGAKLGVALVVAAGAGGVASCSDTSESEPTAPARIVVSPAAEELSDPLDATPDPNGNNVFFTASSGSDKAVFRVDFGGGTPVVVVSGGLLTDPRGIASSGDGETAYVADHATPGGGALLAVTIATGAVVPIAGTEGTEPVALDIEVDNAGTETLYFAGKSEGEPALFAIGSAGGTATVLAKGAPLVEPDGVAVARNGNIYVADKKGGKGQGGALMVSGSQVTAFGPPLIAGDPAGTALLLDNSALLVSSLAEDGQSLVNILATADGSASTYGDVIGPNRRSGGLHRALYVDRFAWIGKKTVYGIKIQSFDSSTIGGPGD